MHWRACRAVVACWMADVTESVSLRCAADVGLVTSHEPHSRLTPLLHTPHGRAHAADRERKCRLSAWTDGPVAAIVTFQSKYTG